MKKTILILLLALLIDSCKKKDTPEPEAEPEPVVSCDDIYNKRSEPFTVTAGASCGNNAIRFDPYFGMPSVNPGNAFQFSYIKKDGLYIYDLCTNQSRLLVPKASSMDWGNNNQLLYYFQHGDLSKINADSTGAGSLKLPFSMRGHWSPDGKQILYYNSEAYNMFVVNADGSNPRRWYRSFEKQGLWRSNTEILIMYEDTLLNIISADVNAAPAAKILLTFPPNFGFEYTFGISKDGNTLLAALKDGLYTCDLTTLSKNKIVSHPANSYLMHPDFVDGKIIAQRVTTVLQGGQCGSTSEIVILNPDGSNERRIKIP